MKKALFLLTLFLSMSTLQAQSFKVATYNLRYNNPGDIGNLWKDRSPYVAKLIQYHDFDFFGTQEGFPDQLEDLKALLSHYDYYGEGRDGNNQGEHAAIFYKRERYTLLNKGDFWLSATPSIPSKSWDASCCNRICSWVELKDKQTKRKFFVFNAHYDYEKQYARDQSSLLVLNKIREIADNSPVIFMGDLNGTAEDTWCQIISNSGILRDAYFDVENPYANNSSFNAWGKFEDLDEMDTKLIEEKQIIDHIYFSKHFKTDRWGMLTDTYNYGKFPTDHFPILVNAAWKKK